MKSIDAVLLLDSMGEGVYGVDAAGHCTFINPAALKMLGFSAEEILGRNQHRLFHHHRPDGTDYPATDCPVWQTLQDGEKRHAEEEWFWRRNGEGFPVSLTVTPLPDTGAAGRGAVVVFRDLSERKQMEAQLFQARKMESIGVLAGGIAHDFNNILTPVIMRTEMSLARLAPEDPVHRNLQQIRQAALRARQLVKQILDFSRRQPHEPQPLHLGGVIKEGVKFLRSALPAGVELHYRIDTDHDAVEADPTQMLQVIINLATNAAHATRRHGGIVTISLAEWQLKRHAALPAELAADRDYLLLTVTDHGEGIDPAIKDKIFEPYFTTKNRGEGTGMGLAVVHGIVKAADGAVAVTSEPGRGTTVSVWLPRSAAPVEDAATTDAPPAGELQHILLPKPYSQQTITAAINRALDGGKKEGKWNSSSD